MDTTGKLSTPCEALLLFGNNVFAKTYDQVTSSDASTPVANAFAFMTTIPVEDGFIIILFVNNVLLLFGSEPSC